MGPIRVYDRWVHLHLHRERIGQNGSNDHLATLEVGSWLVVDR